MEKQEQEQVQEVVSELKRAILLDNTFKAELLLRRASNEGALPQTTLLQLQTYLEFSKMSMDMTSDELKNAMKVIAATKL